MTLYVLLFLLFIVAFTCGYAIGLYHATYIERNEK